ncbi:MAG: nucleotidyltransferase family protein [Anaerococcus prevotii]|uniref:tRNA(Met) cytidine acetate ligase n=1 Tax=Anaerococcus prevotii TaxID=33034 RepID=UPI0029027CD5|nr:nucleotidyltransferase family protein [Anaerococcus prevotii]MDU2558091.1 nucleotidyltransferase family protein [Anaerococcus prevotii]MDU2583775.1 nucleotidyltransferase family protein [Anaerococcus prevotii]
MKKLAIISEFNPFHNGHKYLIDKAKEVTKTDLAISLMSGDFVQRGEASLIDKYSRADAALDNGFDLVIEMPNFISLQSAEFFSYKSIELLNKLKIDYLAFGIENLDSEDFLDISARLIKDNDRLEELTKYYIDKKYSFTEAKYLALKDFLGREYFISSNNILALEYMRSISKINPNIKAIPIRRLGANNQDLDIKDEKYASSTSIRMNLSGNIEKLMPSSSYQKLISFQKNYGLVKKKNLFDIFKYKFMIEESQMQDSLCYEEGLDNYFKTLLKDSPTYDEFIELAVSKRNTMARIKRLMLNYILNNKKFLNDLDYNFVKVLAFNEKATKLFRDIKKELKIVIRKSDIEALDHDDLLVYENMLRASNLYSLLIDRQFNTDFTRKISIKKTYEAD